MSDTESNSSSDWDIAIILFASLFVIFLFTVAFFVIKYREYEFNRIWRTRLLLLFIVLLFAISFVLTILHWFPNQFASVNHRFVACSITEFIHSCALLPFFLAAILGFVRALADSSALLSAHPNRGVLLGAVIWTSPIAAAGIVNIVMASVGTDITFFHGYDESGEQCVVSPYYGTLLTVFTITLFVVLLPQTGLCFQGDDLTKPRLNVLHRARSRRLPLFMIAFILIGPLSIGAWYMPDPWPRLVGYIDWVVSLVILTIYLYYFIVAPLWESTEVQLLRGSLTLRHGVFLDETLNGSPPVSGMEPGLAEA
jgi:hypothetical protein